MTGFITPMESTMIKADAGWVAQFEHGGMTEDVPIVAWSDEGKPLVVEWSTGNLVAPTELRDKGSFRRVVQGGVVSTVPGDGWRVRMLQKWGNRDDEWQEHGVAAFEIRGDRSTVAVIVTPTGGVRRHEIGDQPMDSVWWLPPGSKAPEHTGV